MLYHLQKPLFSSYLNAITRTTRSQHNKNPKICVSLFLFATREAEDLVISTVFVFVSYVIQVKTAAAFKKTLLTLADPHRRSVRPVSIGDPSVASGLTDLAKTWQKEATLQTF
jgi:hypothetical protein